MLTETKIPIELQDWHKNGISPNDQSARRLLQLDQPCLKDIKRDLNMLQEQIKTVSEDGEFIHVKTAVESGNFVTPRDKRRYDQDQQLLQNYMDKQSLIRDFLASDRHIPGHVLSASGYNTIKK